MIITILLYVIGAILGVLISLLSLLSPASGIVYPPQILAGFQLFGNSLASVNFLVDTYDLALAITFFIKFIIYYFSAFLIIFIIKMTRGN